jgi:hypothetical protein
MLTETRSAGKHCMKQLGLDDSGFVKKPKHPQATVPRRDGQGCSLGTDTTA